MKFKFDGSDDFVTVDFDGMLTLYVEGTKPMILCEVRDTDAMIKAMMQAQSFWEQSCKSNTTFSVPQKPLNGLSASYSPGLVQSNAL